ncbi:MAG TPA: hypothetical protein VH583_02470 [Vicinamibacterales bacterium]|jgi:hypothetical protein
MAGVARVSDEATCVADTRALSSQRVLTVLAIAAGAVLLRCIVYLLHEQLVFDSDQAINGLMAKHLVEHRAFPLFFYGQTYMLAVEAWVAAPFFLVAGPTVGALRSSIFAWNVAFAVILIVALCRDGGLDPWMALVSAAVFLLAPASVGAQLMQAQGGIIEPFVYVGLLWLLRKRPLWFGAVLAIGFRNREFVAYAVPALILVELASGEVNRARLGEWLAAAVVFVAVWEAIEALKPYADLLGPGTRGQLIGGFAGSQFNNLVNRFDFGYATVPERIARMGPGILAWFSGAGQVDTSFPLPDRRWLSVLSGVFVLFVAVRLVYLFARPEADERARWWTTPMARAKRTSVAIYFAIIGAEAIVVFLVGKPVLSGYSRYALLGLLLPVGLIAALLTLEPATLVRRGVTTAIVAWALLTAADHLSFAVGYSRHPEIDAARVVSDKLIADGRWIASAGYWRAYVITFVSRERLHVASDSFIRIQQYQDEFAEHAAEAVLIADTPCPGGERVGVLYVCKP